MNRSRFVPGQDQDPAAVPDSLALFQRMARELEKLDPDDAARIAQTLATWFSGAGPGPDDEEP